MFCFISYFIVVHYVTLLVTEQTCLNYCFNGVSIHSLTWQKLKSELHHQQDRLNTVSQKAHSLKKLTGTEQVSTERLEASVWTSYNDLSGTMDDKCKFVEKMADKQSECQISQLNEWLEEQMAAADSFDYIRLLAFEVDKQLERCKVDIYETGKAMYN